MREPTGSVRMPAEWEPHEASWLAYPHLSSDWPGKLTAARWAHAEFIRHLCRHERVHLLVRSPAEAKRARSLLRRAGADLRQVQVHMALTDRTWLRDSGPTFVHRGRQLGAVCWQFNAWDRYPNWQADRAVGRFIATAAGADAIEPRAGGEPVVMEGGALESNGRGTILTTEQCLLERARLAQRPHATRDDLERVLRTALGASNILWLGRGIAGDDTGGHIDTLARFVGPNRVAAIVAGDAYDENYRPLRDNLRRLRAMRDETGRRIEVVELPLPQEIYFDGCRLPASYANFYIANGVVLVPTFNDPNDRVALQILESCFPEREVCGIHCVDLLVGQGALHCLAQQQPCLPAGT